MDVGLNGQAKQSKKAKTQTMAKRISIHANVCHGQVWIARTRIPVHQVVRMFANGDSLDDLLRAYPSIARADIFACLNYAASLVEEQVTPLDDLVVMNLASIPQRRS